MDNNTESKVLGMLKRKASLQDQVKRYKGQLEGIQSKIDAYSEQIDDIDSNIANLKYNDAKNKEKSKEDDSVTDDPDAMEFEEEADAATTTGSLDAASQSTGGDFGGWKHYSRMGDTQKRPTTKQQKKKNIYNYMDHLWTDES